MPLAYYAHPESSSLMICDEHPGDTCEELGACGEDGPTLPDFKAVFHRELGYHPSEEEIEAMKDALRFYYAERAHASESEPPLL